MKERKKKEIYELIRFINANLLRRSKPPFRDPMSVCIEKINQQVENEVEKELE